jgi:hypothetical protein
MPRIMRKKFDSYNKDFGTNSHYLTIVKAVQEKNVKDAA